MRVIDVRAPLISTYHKEEFLRMYKELTDDEVIEQNKRRADRIKRKEDRMIDTGAYERPRNRQIY